MTIEIDQVKKRLRRLRGGHVLWDGSHDIDGRAYVIVSGKRLYVHRLLWADARGELKPGQRLARTCGVYGCVSCWAALDRLPRLPPRRPVPVEECPRGHLDWSANSQGNWVCDECARVRARDAYRAKRLGKRSPAKRLEK